MAQLHEPYEEREGAVEREQTEANLQSNFNRLKQIHEDQTTRWKTKISQLQAELKERDTTITNFQSFAKINHSEITQLTVERDTMKITVQDVRACSQST